MVCDPSQNTLNIPPPGPGPSLPGLGSPFDIPGIPLPDNLIPDGIPEDLIDLIERIFALFPAGIKFVPNPDGMMKDVWDAIASLLNQLAPFLAFYKFIQALLDMVLCIIDVLCALTNPWALARAIRRLFKVCLPNFLSLFPWIALIIMILALILLLIAIILYIIQLIIAYIKDLIENIVALTRAIQIGAEEGIIAIVNKLAYLLCLIENLFSILLALAAIFAVIQPLMGIFGRGVCVRGQSDCCTDDFCPSFIANAGNNGQVSTSGNLIYYKQISFPNNLGSQFDFLSNIPGFVQRRESWQFTDDDNEEFKFIDIITPSPEYGFIYWPEGESYTKDANIVKVPYTLDLTLTVDPADWGNPDDISGERMFSIQNLIVEKKPTVAPSDETGNVNFDYSDLFSGNLKGAISLVGGSVYEWDGKDGYTEYTIDGIPATIETFLTKDPGFTIPAFDDGYTLLNLNYNFKPNHPSLVDKKLVTLMCNPDNGDESEVVNAEFSEFASVFEQTGADLPDILGAVDCLNEAMSNLRSNLNEESALEFQANSITCLEDLLQQASDFYCKGATAAADIFATQFSLDPEIQFVERPITVSVELREKTGTQLAVNVPADVAECIANALKGEVTLGEISEFTYDGYGLFLADITSSEPGLGELKVKLSGQYLSEVLNRDNIDVVSEIVERSLDYEFIDKTSITYRRPDQNTGDVRFGPEDVAEDGS